MITIRGYHGYVSKDMRRKLDKIAVPIDAGATWEFYGPLSKFIKLWDEKFFYLPSGETPRIFVTQYSSFNTR